MELCGKYFSGEVVERIRGMLIAKPEISRSSLSRQVCELLDWRSANGKLCEVSCRKALLELDRRGLIDLPQREQSQFFKRSSRTIDSPRKARKANLLVKFAPVEIRPPRRLADLPRLKMWAVHAVEEGGPKKEDPIEWMLLTNVEVSTFEQAVQRIQWYAGRWNIEVFHRILKSGCRIEDRRLSDCHRLESCLILDMVVAWRIFFLTKLGRETPDLPCDTILSEDEWKVLWACIERKATPDEPPSLFWAVLAIAAMGGFLGRKSDGFPGTVVMWRGITRLYDRVEGWRYSHFVNPQSDGP